VTETSIFKNTKTEVKTVGQETPEMKQTPLPKNKKQKKNSDKLLKENIFFFCRKKVGERTAKKYRKLFLRKNRTS
jgi:hypothetical protein